MTSRNKLNISSGRPWTSMNESVISSTAPAVVERVLLLPFLAGGARRGNVPGDCVSMASQFSDLA